jgi:hypothetical protein
VTGSFVSAQSQLEELLLGIAVSRLTHAAALLQYAPGRDVVALDAGDYRPDAR